MPTANTPTTGTSTLASNPPPVPTPPFSPFNDLLQPVEFHNYVQDPPLHDPVSGELLPPVDQYTEYEQYRHFRPTPPILADNDPQHTKFHTLIDTRSERKHFFTDNRTECIERFDQQVEVRRQIAKTTVEVRFQVSGSEKALGEDTVADVKYLKEWTSKVEIPVELFQRGSGTPTIGRGKGDGKKAGGRIRKKNKGSNAIGRRKSGPFQEESDEADAEDGFVQ